MKLNSTILRLLRKDKGEIMKRLLLFLSLGIIGTVAVLKTMNGKKPNGEHISRDKNFGAFPPDIPASQFDDLFI